MKPRDRGFDAVALYPVRANVAPSVAYYNPEIRGEDIGGEIAVSLSSIILASAHKTAIYAGNA